ncbi:MAG: hypothetical protein AAFX00_06635 [Pseudomonadota bacterium]
MLVGLRDKSTKVFLIRVGSPFYLSELLAFMCGVSEGLHPGVSLDTPIIADIRGVNIRHIGSKNISKYIRKRISLTAPSKAGVVAAICDNDFNYGMLRMFGIYADIYGLRSENDFCVADGHSEAVAFMSRRLGLGAQDQANLVEALAELRE